MVAKKRLMFLLLDSQNRAYYWDGTKAQKSSLPVWLKNNPDGWKDMTFQFDTNDKYFSTLRAFSSAVKFVADGKKIILDRAINGNGTEEIMYLAILKNDPSKGLNYYGLQYKARLDFSTLDADPHTGVSMNTLQDDVFSIVQANEDVKYSIPCNSSNPAAVKVLFDGTLMQDKLNYSFIDSPIEDISVSNWWTVPIAFKNNEGDSVDIIFNSQNYDNFADPNYYVTNPSASNFIIQPQRSLPVRIQGVFSFTWTSRSTTSGGINVMFAGSNNVPGTGVSGTFAPRSQFIFSNNDAYGHNPPYDDLFHLVVGQTYTVPFDISMVLAPNEKLFLLINLEDSSGNGFKITPLVTDLSFTYESEQIPSIAYALRPLDYLQQLVSKITNGVYSANSKYFATNNKKVILSGSSLRSFPDAEILFSFSDFFQSYKDRPMGITVRDSVLWMEPLEDIYNSDNLLIDLGQVSKAKLAVANKFIYSSAKVGYLKQVYNKRNGRYEYNCTHNYKFPINCNTNELNLVSVARGDSFGMEFIRTGYPDLNSTDDKGDADVFVTMITDEVGQTDGIVSTAIAATIETLILAAPVIKTPFSNVTVYTQQPTITGRAQVGKIITVYVDGFIDGTTIVDANGNWVYQIATALRPLSLIYNGVHLIEANAQTDPTNISSFSNLISLTVNTGAQAPFLFEQPTNNDTLYNNLPLIRGSAPFGAVVTIKLDGTTLATVTADGSSVWTFQTTAPIPDGVHVLTATSPGLAPAPALNLTFNKNVATPLITSILYGDIIYNNTPLIKGVGIPGATVTIYVDGIGGFVTSGIAAPLGTTTVDANGDWSFQVTQYYDFSNLLYAYIPDGLHIFSTTQDPANVSAAITGYKLMRGTNGGSVMDFDAIRLDDAYIPPGVDPTTLPPTLGQFLHPETLFNIIGMTPLRIFRNWDLVTNSFVKNQVGQVIYFNGADLNANLVTKKGTQIFNEGAAVNVSDLGPNLWLPWILSFTAKIPASFNQIMTSINNDGYIQLSFNDTIIYCLALGSMSMKPATDEAQEWKLLVSSKTPLAALISIFETGTTLNIGTNMIHLAEYNPLHFVKYNYTPPAGYHFAEIYDDWEKNRYPHWVAQPDYAQPLQFTDTLNLQCITNGVSSAALQMISCTTGKTVATLPFAPVVGSIVSLPNILQEVSIPMATYPEDDYWFGLFVDGSMVAISEKIALRSDWPDTFLYEYGGSEDKINFYFSSGIMPSIRMQSLFLPWEPMAETDIYEDEVGDFEITRGIPLIKKILQIGNSSNLVPEWMAKKINAITLLTNWRIEGVQYTRNASSELAKQDDGTGYPNYRWKMEVVLADNENGVTFATPGSSATQSTVYILDATAIGQQPGVVNVTAND